MVQVHLAPVAGGYTVDLCRTLFAGNVPFEAAKAHASYLEAQEAGIAAARQGTPLSGIDDAMSEVLRKSGYGEAFLRPVFHGVGMEHEEAPIPGGHAVIHGEEKVPTSARGANRRAAAMTTRKASDATLIRTALKAWGLSSRNALLMTEKLLPQMIVIRSRRTSRRVKWCRVPGAGVPGFDSGFTVQVHGSRRRRKSESLKPSPEL